MIGSPFARTPSQVATEKLGERDIQLTDKDCDRNAIVETPDALKASDFMIV